MSNKTIDMLKSADGNIERFRESGDRRFILLAQEQLRAVVAQMEGSLFQTPEAPR